MAMSPDGASIVTGGADESIRFWKVFPPEKKEEEMRSKLSNDATSLR
jgi:WD40 repeat protein